LRKLTYYVAITIDGFIAAPDGSFDFYLLEGDHMAAITARFPETIPTAFRDAFGITAENDRFDTVLMGRETYEVGVREGITSPYNHLRQLVFTRNLAESPDPTVEVVHGDPLTTVRELKREDGKGIWLCGGGNLAHQLLPEIDELIVKINPMVIGSGIPLFSGEFQHRSFTLTDSQVCQSGVAIMTYART
jgi:dihydrofolate reductase